MPGVQTPRKYGKKIFFLWGDKNPPLQCTRRRFSQMFDVVRGGCANRLFSQTGAWHKHLYTNRRRRFARCERRHHHRARWIETTGLDANPNPQQRCVDWNKGSREFGALISERDFHIARGLYHLTVRRHQSQPVHRFRDRHVPNLIVLVTNHRAEMAFVRELNRFDSEPRAQNSIQCRRRSTPLKMSEHATAGLLVRSCRDLSSNDIAYPA